MIERGETDGSGVVNIGDGVSVLTHDYTQVKLPVDLPGGGTWVNVQERIACSLQKNDAILYVLENDEYDVFVMLDGSGAKWVHKLSPEHLELIRGDVQ